MKIIDNTIQIHRFTWDVIDSNSYLILNRENGLLIDAIDSRELYDAIEKCRDLIVILTHSHFDHICGLNHIRSIKPDVKVYATRECSVNIGDEHKNMSSVGKVFLSFYYDKRDKKADNIDIKELTCDPANIIFDEDMSFVWEGHEILLRRFYGHSNDSLVVVIDGQYMFSGDTILSIPTVTRFIGGNSKRFWKEDIPRLKEYETDIDMVFPGHGEYGKLKDMVEGNVIPPKYK